MAARSRPTYPNSTTSVASLPVPRLLAHELAGALTRTAERFALDLATLTAPDEGELAAICLLIRRAAEPLTEAERRLRELAGIDAEVR